MLRELPLLKQPIKDAISPRNDEESENYTLPEPQEGGQKLFCETEADVAIFGGAAGSAKSFALLLSAAQHLAVDNYGAVIFRLTSPEVTNEGGLWDESVKLYGKLSGAVSREHLLDWRFPNNTAISFGHADKLKQKYPGAQIAFIGFDEISHWEESDFWFLFSRNRSTCGVKPVIRATCNPDADSFVAKLVEWWIDPGTGYPIHERRGVIRYFYRINEEMHWADTSEELETRFPELAAIAPPKSFTFIYGSIYENKALLDSNPQYLANLLALHPVETERLLKGNWKIRFERGNIFRRSWFEVVEHVAPSRFYVRFWDFAATAKERATSQACYTAAVKMCVINGVFYILDCYWEQVDGGEGDDSVIAIAGQDSRNVKVRWELEGGSAALRYEAHLKRMLSGFDAAAVKPQGDKLTRALPWATAAKQGRIKLLRGDWNDQFLNSCQNYDGKPNPLTNDIIDATSGAFAYLSEFGKMRIQTPQGSSLQQPFRTR